LVLFGGKVLMAHSVARAECSTQSVGVCEVGRRFHTAQGDAVIHVALKQGGGASGFGGAEVPTHQACQFVFEGDGCVGLARFQQKGF
jgi:hypothetical protein